MFQNLRAEMARRKMTAKQLSEEVGFSYESLKNKMSGTTDFKLGEMVAIKRIFPECSYEYLFGLEGGDDVQDNQAS